jgi:hypothetical protein
MPNDLMNRCEQRKEYKVDNHYEWRWKKCLHQKRLAHNQLTADACIATGPCAFINSRSVTAPRITWSTASDRTQNRVEVISTFGASIECRHSRLPSLRTFRSGINL